MLNSGLLEYLLQEYEENTSVVSELDTFLAYQERSLSIAYFRDKLQAIRLEQEKQELTEQEKQRLIYVAYAYEGGLYKEEVGHV